MIIRKKATATTRERDISMRRQKYDTVQVYPKNIAAATAARAAQRPWNKKLKRETEKKNFALASTKEVLWKRAEKGFKKVIFAK